MSGGVKHDESKPLLALIPPEAIEEEGWVWTFGGKKYGLWNWTRGLAYTRILSAMLRHTMAIMRGEDVDPESGRLHAAHIRCCAGMLVKFQKDNRTDLDDRNKVPAPAKPVLVTSPIKTGDLMEHIDDPGFVVECLGLYYDANLTPLFFFRAQDGNISSRPIHEFKPCSQIERITEGVL